MSIEIQSWEKIDRGSSAEKTDFEQIISLPKEALNNKHLPTNFLIRFDFGAYLVQ